jgi:hypothetical protein
MLDKKAIADHVEAGSVFLVGPTLIVIASSVVPFTFGIAALYVSSLASYGVYAACNVLRTAHSAAGESDVKSVDAATATAVPAAAKPAGGK